MYKKIHENNYLQNQMIFNIQENEDETTGNFVKINLKQKRTDHIEQPIRQFS